MPPYDNEVKHLPISPVIRHYLVKSCSPSDPVMESLVARTAELGDPSIMMVPQEQAALLTLLARIVSARQVLELGTFTGMSTLSFARGVAPEGRVVTCDITDQWAEIAREHWTRAGVADRIDFRIAPAIETLRAIPPGTVFDLVFLDADSRNYPAYFKYIEPMLRPGGLLIVDNVLRNGYVLLDPRLADEATNAACTPMRELNETLATAPQFDTVMLPVSDGLTIARKKDYPF